LQQHQQQQQQQQQVLTSAAAESIPAGDDADGGSGSSSALGPTAENLVKDYAEAYASMKETMEVRAATYLTVYRMCKLLCTFKACTRIR
jgi:hypothetical protein